MELEETEKAANPTPASHLPQILAVKMANQFYGDSGSDRYEFDLPGLLFFLIESPAQQRSQDGHKDAARLDEKPPEKTESLLVLFAEQGLGGWSED